MENYFESIKYLQRDQFINKGQDLIDAIQDLKRITTYSNFFKITKLGKDNKKEETNTKKNDRIPTEDLLTGLYSLSIPIAFLITNQNNIVSVEIGTWSVDLNVSNRNAYILESTLKGSQTFIEYKAIRYSPLNKFEKSGILIGIPSSKIESEKLLPIDRLFQALNSSEWQYLILAEPNSENLINDEFMNLSLELKEASDTIVNNQTTPYPEIEHYLKLLKAGLKHIQLGKEVGSWQTSVFLSGDDISYYKLSGLWKAVYSGEKSKPEPIQILEDPNVKSLINSMQSLTSDKDKPGPTIFQHPYYFKTILNSSQLASYIHFPTIETPGISLIRTQELDTVPQTADPSKRHIKLGSVIQRKEKKTNTLYEIEIDKLTKHCFISGITGAGKTNTIFQILLQLYNKYEIPFLVIEPAKTEYRALLNNADLIDKLMIFTPGNELISPFRLNPFEVVEWGENRTSVSVHIDLLRSVFSASFGMWTPLPQILEQCLFEIYKDRGWDITLNKNYRLKSTDKKDIEASFPTLTDLAAKVEEVISKLGYDQKIADDMKAALLTRINSLRTGGKGKMLDVQYSFPIDFMLNNPTILELEGMGDDDDKAFIMGILYIRMVEFRRVQGTSKELKHILVFEEAHRLLSNVDTHAKQEEANPRGKAVEAFSNILSEIRTYGQGIIIADQIPVKLSPDVIKNTNLKIAHRCVAEDDRKILAGSMSMTEEQNDIFTTLETKKGEAVVFAEGDDKPILISVGEIDEKHRQWPVPLIVKKAMDPDEKDPLLIARQKIIKPLVFSLRPLQTLIPFINEREDLKEIETAKVICDVAEFRKKFVRYILIITEMEDADDEAWKSLISLIQPFQKEGMDNKKVQELSLYFCAEWFVNIRGTQNGWSYTETLDLKETLQNLLLSNFNNKNLNQFTEKFRQLMKQLHTRKLPPINENCFEICKNKVCLYRQAVNDYIRINDSEENEIFGDGSNLESAWELSKFVAVEIVIPIVNDLTMIVQRIGLCYAQQMVIGKNPVYQTNLFNGLYSEINKTNNKYL